MNRMRSKGWGLPKVVPMVPLTLPGRPYSGGPHCGAVSAANEAGYEVLWNGPASEADFAHQIRILDDLINRRVNGILIAPSDREALVPAIERAHRADIPY